MIREEFDSSGMLRHVVLPEGGTTWYSVVTVLDRSVI
jgi:hypothetical protein